MELSALNSAAFLADMKQTIPLLACIIALPARAVAGDDLAAAFDSPPLAARTRCFWWWLNGNVDKAAITKDLEWMKSIDMGGGLIYDGAVQPDPRQPAPCSDRPHGASCLCMR